VSLPDVLCTERIASQAFDMVKGLNSDHFSDIIRFGSFADLTVCITDFCKVNKYQKISLHAIEMLRGLVPQMLDTPECLLHYSHQPQREEAAQLFWFPVLFGFYDVIMNGEDLEVRKRYGLFLSQFH
jgi:brefeldin A-inhibited guanine nucleotide-exchange protein